MTTTLLIGWVLVLTSAGILMSVLAWAAQSKRYARYRIRTPETYRIPLKRKIINISLNMMLSPLLFLVFFYYFAEQTFYQGDIRGVVILGEGLAALLLYDFLYYFMHRAGHHPKLMKWVHGVHHCVRFPTSPESVYLHPAETIAGISLLCFSFWLIGPVHELSFLLALFVHNTANVLVHSNLVLPHPSMRLFNYWAVKHDHHHHKLKHNYASIFPFWDQAFGTYK